MLDLQDRVKERITAFEDPMRFPWNELDPRDVLILFLMARLEPVESNVIWLEGLHDRLLADFVKAGGSLLALHSAIADYPPDSSLSAVLKGRFTHHPEGLQELKVSVRAEHPVTQGVESFNISDEQYFVDLDENGTTVLLEADSGEYGGVPAGWAHSIGEGRVVVLTPGHTIEVLQHPMMQRLMLNSFAWFKS